MKNRFLCFMLFCLYATAIFSQHNLLIEEDFFKNRSKDYSQWLALNDLNSFFKLDKITVEPNKVVMFLWFKGKQEQDSAYHQILWKQLRHRYFQSTNQELHIALLSKMSFQFDLPLDSSEIVIQTSNFNYKIHIYGEKNIGTTINVRWKEYSSQAMGNGNINIALNELKEVFRVGNKQIKSAEKIDLTRARNSIKAFFRNFYLDKHTELLWKARMDTTNEWHNELSYTITHISREILKSHSYFELHQIDVKIDANEIGLNISWSFQAKYGGGLIFPPRNDSNDYHDFESSQYKDQFTKYQSKLFKSLEMQFRAL